MSIRSLYFIGFLAACFSLATGYAIQFLDGIHPCPLCILQRFCFGVLAGLFLFDLLFHRQHLVKQFLNFLAILFALLGMVLAGRQTWLQYYPGDGNECGVSLQYMLQVLPLQEVLQKVFVGSSECAQRSWEFLSLSMAEWSFALFFGFFIYSIYLMNKERLCR